MSVFAIAEAGVNHNGSIDLAKKLVDVASDAGADAVKFQSFKAENIATKKSSKALYQQNALNKEESQFSMLKKIELDEALEKSLCHTVNIKNIIFMSSPFDRDSIELLNKLDSQIFKIPSGEITNLPYLKNYRGLNKKIIMSTGMSNISEIKDALEILLKVWNEKENITVLHANTEYPTPIEDVTNANGKNW